MALGVDPCLLRWLQETNDINDTFPYSPPLSNRLLEYLIVYLNVYPCARLSVLEKREGASK